LFRSLARQVRLRRRMIWLVHSSPHALVPSLYRLAHALAVLRAGSRPAVFLWPENSAGSIFSGSMFAGGSVHQKELLRRRRRACRRHIADEHLAGGMRDY